VPYASFASSLGLNAIKVDDPAEVGRAWDEALSADRPSVLEFVTDPAVPPIPPHATLDQIEKATLSLLRGDGDRWDVVKEGLLLKAQELLPGTRK
jgi:pyruvate dehydrogenase (quinone)